MFFLRVEVTTELQSTTMYRKVVQTLSATDLV